MKSISDINKKIKSGDVVVLTAEEIPALVDEVGFEEAFNRVDVVTTATFGPMCSSGAFLNFGHSDPPIRMQNIYLNNVSAYGGLAAVDTYIGATEESTDNLNYGGAHVICDLISNKEINLKATSKGTDCYPNKFVNTSISLKDINEAYLFNPRNAYQNYSAAINTSNKDIFTYMGTLKSNSKNITYCNAGALSPLLNDPEYRTIGIGTKILLAGAEGFISWQGTQFNSSTKRSNAGVPISPSGTLAVIGDLKDMNSNYIKPVVFKNYGISLFIGIGVPIPVIDKQTFKAITLTDDDIFTNVVDYSVESRNKPVLKTVSYKELRSGEIDINGKKIKTAPISNLNKAREIAEDLKSKIKNGAFTLTEPVKKLPLNNSLNHKI